MKILEKLEGQVGPVRIGANRQFPALDLDGVSASTIQKTDPHLAPLWPRRSGGGGA